MVASPQLCLFCDDMISVDSRYIANIDLTAKYKHQAEAGHITLTPNQLQLENSEAEGESQNLSQNNILLENPYAR